MRNKSCDKKGEKNGKEYFFLFGCGLHPNGACEIVYGLFTVDGVDGHGLGIGDPEIAAHGEISQNVE